ncbi:GNAT family N-acetyltransferase [Haliangium sp.]|uniref:GNAT family N-acetyltransferase n=1 Tax=Haliangium sp. TaxID=2663208 RepID=UPI003D139F90
MTVEFSLIRDFSELEALREPWRALAEAGGAGALFRGPDWLLPWWLAYHQVLQAELHVLAGRDGDRLVCLAPFYTRSARWGPGLKVREVRLMGDAGPRPPALDLLFEPGYEDRAGAALAQHLAAEDQDWDVIELEPLRDPSRGRGVLVSRVGNAGYSVRSQHAAGGALRIALAAAGIEVGADADDDRATAYTDDATALRKGLSALKRLSRLEWADREEASPLADREAAQLLEDVTLRLGREHRARLARLDDGSNEAIAIALVVDDGDRAVVLALAVDPRHEAHAPARLLSVEAQAAAVRGQVALDVVPGAAEHALPSLPTSRQRALRLQIFGSTGAATMARTYGAVRKRVEAAREAPGTAAASARAAWAKIRTAASPVAGYDRMHLYRGELWTRDAPPPEGLVLGTFSEAEFDALDEALRGELIRALDLDEAYCRKKWQRGDLVILARLHERPAGIAWCARAPVHVPELDRTLDIGPSEAYIHDVYVAPAARGRAVAPSMLDYLARELRQRDVYRGWALIGSDNTASVRAFEKAAYTALADVVHARIGNVDRLIVRPPDPEAKKLLGLT